MSLRIAKWIPGFVRRAMLRYKEKIRLDGVASVACDASSLMDASSFDVTGILTSVEIHHAWVRAHALLDRFPIIEGHGGINPGDRRAIFHLVRALAPRSVLEIGTHVGASTLHIATALSQLPHGTEDPPKFVTVDIADVNCPERRPWERHGAQYSPAQMMRDAGFDPFVRFVTSDALTFLESNDEKFNFIFLDGSHAATAVYREIPAALRALAPGGVILLHDYFPDNKPLWPNGALIPGPFMAVERHRVEGAKVRIQPLGSLPWPTKAGSNTTSLALLMAGD